MLVLERDLVEARRVALALTLELREASLRTLSVQSLEEAVESALEIDERLLTYMCRDLVQPGRVALLQLDESFLEVSMLGPLSRDLVRGLRFGESPVVDVPARADALRQLDALRPVRVELERVALLG